MPPTEHSYGISVEWVGNHGSGTSSYSAYGRDHQVTGPGLQPIPGSADPAFRGDPGRWNPEQLQVAALSQCHMLWYLHLASAAGVVVTAYTDHAEGLMRHHRDGSGEFTQVTLHPHVTISADSNPDLAHQLHQEVGAKCFIARSVNFPVHHEPTITVSRR